LKVAQLLWDKVAGCLHLKIVGKRSEALPLSGLWGKGLSSIFFKLLCPKVAGCLHLKIDIFFKLLGCAQNFKAFFQMQINLLPILKDGRSHLGYPKGWA
jgi:hypothetical protein